MAFWPLENDVRQKVRDITAMQSEDTTEEEEFSQRDATGQEPYPHDHDHHNRIWVELEEQQAEQALQRMELENLKTGIRELAGGGKEEMKDGTIRSYF